MTPEDVCTRFRKGKWRHYRIVCHLFDACPWNNKDKCLEAVGLINEHERKFTSVSKRDALEICAKALAYDMWYGGRRASIHSTRQLVTDFFSAFTEDAIYFTNSEVPYHLKGSVWAGFSLMADVTTDTGVIVGDAGELRGVLWIGDND